jgi:GntR family transcriptional regulator, transcriptional repressor for pyruvate dehydrogenase complex
MNAMTPEPAFGHDTVTAQVARHLLSKISEQQLRPGDIIDSEVQVSRELEVSRGSVREAYRVLAALGVLDIGNGRRPRVHAVNSGALAQIFGHALQIAQATPLHVQEFRRGVEIQGAQLAARFASAEQLRTLRTLVSEMRSSVEDEPRRRSADMAIHITLAEASNNPLNTLSLTALQSAIAQSLRGDYGVQRSEAEIVRIIDVHEAVVEAVCTRDPVAAGAAMSCHFDLSINSLFRSAKTARPET